MKHVDSTFKANVKMYAGHHIALGRAIVPGANGHQAVGIDNIPFPIWAHQAYCDWDHWDICGGTTGTIAVAPDPKPAAPASFTYHTSQLPKTRRMSARTHGLCTPGTTESGISSRRQTTTSLLQRRPRGPPV